MISNDIRERQDIELLVNSFYEKVNNDELLSLVFNGQANVDWNEHLPRMYEFWETQLLGSGTYKGQPFPPHSLLHISRKHFERWLKLFTETVDTHFSGLSAELAKQKARNIAAVFQAKLGLV